MKCKRQVIRSYPGLLLACAVLLQVNFLRPQAPSAGSGQAIPIAVMEFEGNGISQTEAIALTDRLRNELFRLGAFEVVERGMMETILNEQDFQLTGCTSNECLVEVGQLLGARQIVGGSISKVGGTFTVSARLVDVETGKVLEVSDFDLRGELDDMLTQGMRQVAMMLSGGDMLSEEVTAMLSEQPPAESEAPIQAKTPSLAAMPIHRVQLRGGYWTSGDEDYDANRILLTGSYYLGEILTLRTIPINLILTGGYYSTYDTWYDEDFDGWADDSYKGLFGVIEISPYWAKGNLGLSAFAGIGVSSASNDYYYFDEEIEDWDSDEYKDMGVVFSGGAAISQSEGFLFIPPLRVEARLLYDTFVDERLWFISLGIGLFRRGD